MTGQTRARERGEGKDMCAQPKWGRAHACKRERKGGRGQARMQQLSPKGGGEEGKKGWVGSNWHR